MFNNRRLSLALFCLCGHLTETGLPYDCGGWLCNCLRFLAKARAWQAKLTATHPPHHHLMHGKKMPENIISMDYYTLPKGIIIFTINK